MRKHPVDCPCFICTRRMIRKHCGDHRIYWKIAKNPTLAPPRNSTGGPPMLPIWRKK